MEYEKKSSLDGVPIRVPTSDDYGTCSVCGGDCEPDPAFVCAEHGVQSLVDPFEHLL
ncbi:hypothetical protein [Microbacterium sp.]|uniref:hypothetical protein n=1 Tax=Microbacterium sp. TaxID=51671 RepID=UPI0028128BE2|nr:hypothetical protein [Microbacterium sp.]